MHIQGGSVKPANLLFFPPTFFLFKLVVLSSGLQFIVNKIKTVLLLPLPQLLLLLKEKETVELRQFWRVDVSQWWRRLSGKRLVWCGQINSPCRNLHTDAHQTGIALVVKGVASTALFDLMCQQRARSGTTGMHTRQLGSIIHSVAKRRRDAALTVVQHASVLVGQADVRLLLGHHRHVLGPQAGSVAGEDEGVAVGARAVLGQLPARVVHGVVVVVGVDDPVDVVCGGESKM